jgi:membrane protease YdiL (CAAX protease family)
MLRSLASFLFAGLLSALLFGLAHLDYPDPRKVILGTLLGLFAAWTYERTSSVITPIGIHMASNCWFTALSLWGP